MTQIASALIGRVAMITGAAGGIGAAGTRLLARSGVTVVGADVLDGDGQRCFDDLGPPHRYVHMDIADAAQWRAVLPMVHGDLGRLDLLWLNAGVMARARGAAGLDDPLPTVTAEDYHRVFGINVGANIIAIEAAVPLLRLYGGDIILTASRAGLSPYAHDPLYTASKAAIVALTRALGPALGRVGVRVNCICPGPTDTPMTPADNKRPASCGVAEARPPRQPPGRVGEAVLRILEDGGTGGVWSCFPGEDPSPIEFPGVFTR